jgi:hypothetical protein
MKRVIAIFTLPEGCRPLKDAELAYMDSQNHYQWERTREIREIPPKPVKVKITRRKD